MLKNNIVQLSFNVLVGVLLGVFGVLGIQRGCSPKNNTAALPSSFQERSDSIVNNSGAGILIADTLRNEFNDLVTEIETRDSILFSKINFLMKWNRVLEKTQDTLAAEQRDIFLMSKKFDL